MPEFVDPTSIFNQVELKKDMTAADFGCGSGGWAIPLAQKLEDGIVFAVDIQEGPLSALDSRAKLQGIGNIKKIIADVEKPISGIVDGSCDLVLMTDLLFQVEEKEEVFKEARRILKPKGKVLIVDWEAQSGLGPKEGRVSAEEVKSIAKRMGFYLDKKFQAGSYHYGLVFVKQ